MENIDFLGLQKYFHFMKKVENFKFPLSFSKYNLHLTKTQLKI